MKSARGNEGELSLKNRKYHLDIVLGRKTFIILLIGPLLGHENLAGLERFAKR